MLKKTIREIVTKYKLPVHSLSTDVLRIINERAAIKSIGDFTDTGVQYRDSITSILIGYFEDAPLTASRNGFKTAMSTAFVDSFDTGWIDGGQPLPVSNDASDWLAGRQELEFGYISMLFEDAKQLKKEDNFDYFLWITRKVDGYVNTLREVYNYALLAAKTATNDIMVTFEGDDGAESCADCQRLKGKRHKISWFVSRGYVPPFGHGLECGRGGRCQHGLMDDNGNWVTV